MIRTMANRDTYVSGNAHNFWWLVSTIGGHDPKMDDSTVALAGISYSTLALAAVTDGLNRLFSNSLGSVQFTRDFGLAAVDRFPPLKRLLMRDAMGVVGDLPRLVRGEPL